MPNTEHDSEALGALIERLEKAHTPGPWAWFGNAASNTLYLATTHSGRRFVMDFTRWGLQGAQPRFQTERGIMTDAKDLLQFAVGDQSIVGVESAKKDTSVYRLDIRGINSADARLIAAAPDMLDVLMDCATILPRYRLAGKTTGEDEECSALIERVSDVLKALQSGRAS